MSGEQPLNVEWTNVFKRDYKRAMKRNLDISLLDDIIGKLSRRETLPPKNQDHPPPVPALTATCFKGFWAGKYHAEACETSRQERKAIMSKKVLIISSSPRKGGNSAKASHEED